MKDADDLADYGPSIEQVRAAVDGCNLILSQRCDRTVEFAIVADDDVTGQDGLATAPIRRNWRRAGHNQHNECVPERSHGSIYSLLIID